MPLIVPSVIFQDADRTCFTEVEASMVIKEVGERDGRLPPVPPRSHSVSFPLADAV